MHQQAIHQGWTVRAVGDLSEVPQALRELAVPAQVPGCVTTDLLRAGKIPDPYLDDNEFKVRWIGHTDWQYTLHFDADAQLFDHERIDLVADGLDTVAAIHLNGSEIAHAQDVHRGYRFDIRPQLKKGRNELSITFASPVKYANAMWEKLGGRPYVNGAGGRFNFIRKMACNFGWDWGPALPTCGILAGFGWRGGAERRIRSVRPAWDGGALNVDVSWESSTEKSQQYQLMVALTRNGDRDDGNGAITELLDGKTSSRTILKKVDEPKLWWPVGHGDQPLYDLWVQVITYGHGPGEPFRARIGLRTVELDISPDDIGRKFVIKVNGKPIFCKGFNWIPDDCFLDRACEPSRVRQRIQQAVDAGGNMLRVWGGGIYETDDFYSICDEMGVLVWQDFLFACAMYPEEQPFWDEVEAEARYNVARLAHHPSLTLWNGCNENLWAYRDWGWKDAVKDKTWGKNYYFDLLPRVCKELTPTIPYWAGSPWSGDYDVDNGVHPNAATHGNMHVWTTPAVSDYRNYRQYEPRFASEFGVQGPANYSTIAKVVPPEGRDFGSPQMRHRQKSGDPVRDDADRKNLRQIVRDFNLPGAAELLAALDSPDPKGKVPECGCAPLHPAKTLPSKVNFDDLHYLFNVLQCRALTTAVEFWRSRQPTCWGTLYWQLNDCWPGATSWACIDGDGKKKPLWYTTRSFYRDSLATFQPEKDGSLSLYLINNGDSAVQHEVDIAREDFSGKSLADQELDVTVEPRSVLRIPLDTRIATPGDPSSELIWANMKVQPWFFMADREIRYPKPKVVANWDGRWLTIIADSLLRDVCVFADRLDPQAKVSDQMVTFTGGDTGRIEIVSEQALTLEQLTTPPVFRCVNPFGKM